MAELIMAVARILLGKATKNHEAWLVAHGYKVRQSEDGTHIEIDCAEVLGADGSEVAVDPASCAEIIKANKMISYKAVRCFTLEDGSIHKDSPGSFGLFRMGTASALVAKAGKTPKAKAVNPKTIAYDAL
jgi:hypothetical protein